MVGSGFDEDQSQNLDEEQPALNRS